MRHINSKTDEPSLQNADSMRGVSAVDGSSKARLERAAVNLFARGGIDGTSTKDIATRAGLSEGLIYRHFRSKAELARSMMEAEHGRLAAMIRSAEQMDGSLEDKVGQIVDDYCAAAEEDWALFTYYLLHYHRFSTMGETLALADDSPQKAAIDIVKAFQTSGDIPAGDTELRASMALGVVLQAATSKLYGHFAPNLTDMTAILKSAVMAVLKTNQ